MTKVRIFDNALIKEAMHLAAFSGSHLDLRLLDAVVRNPYGRVILKTGDLEIYTEALQKLTGSERLVRLFKEEIERKISAYFESAPGFEDFRIKSRELFGNLLQNYQKVSAEMLWDLADWMMDASLEALWKALPDRKNAPSVKELPTVIASSFETIRMFGLPLAIAASASRMQTEKNIEEKRKRFSAKANDVINAIAAMFPNMLPNREVWRKIRNSEHHSMTTYDPQTASFTFRSVNDMSEIKMEASVVEKFTAEVALSVMSIAEVVYAYFVLGGIPLLIHLHQNEPVRLVDLSNRFGAAMERQSAIRTGYSVAISPDGLREIIDEVIQQRE